MRSSSRSDRLRVTPLLAALVLLLVVTMGCGHDEPSRPDATSALPVEAALISSIVEQGDATTITLYGALPNADWTATRANARVLHDPVTASGSNEASDGEVEVRVYGHANGATMGEGAPAASYAFDADLPPLAEGSWILRVVNPDGSTRETPFQVVPRGVWIRYRSFGDAAAPDLDLAVNENGLTLARLEGAPPMTPVRLTEEQLATLRAAFEAADFASLADSYVSDPPAEGRHVDVILRTEETRKRVQAEMALMPAKLAQLDGVLHELTSTLLATTPPIVPVYGRLTIDPATAGPGTARHLTLTVVNESANDVTLHFNNGLQFDLAILRPTHGHMGGPHDGDDGPGHDGAVLWQLSHLVDPTPEPTTLSVVAHGTATFEADWNGSAENGVAVGPGGYECVGRIPAIDRRVPVLPLRLQVTGQAAPLRLSLTVEPASAPAGTARTLTLSATNATDLAVELQFNSTQHYEFAVDDPRMMSPGFGNQWLWSRGKGFGDPIEHITWQPHETKTFVEIWDGRSNRPGSGEPGLVVSPGHYTGLSMVTASVPIFAPLVRVIVTR